MHDKGLCNIPVIPFPFGTHSLTVGQLPNLIKGRGPDLLTHATKTSKLLEVGQQDLILQCHIGQEIYKLLSRKNNMKLTYKGVYRVSARFFIKSSYSYTITFI